MHRQAHKPDCKPAIKGEHVKVYSKEMAVDPRMIGLRIRVPNEAAVSKAFRDFQNGLPEPIPGSLECYAWKEAVKGRLMVLTGNSDQSDCERLLRDYHQKEIEFFTRYPNAENWALGDA